MDKAIVCKNIIKNKTKVDISPYLFLLPSFAVFFIFMYIPIVNGFILSFQKLKFKEKEWVFLQNYINAFQDSFFIKAIGVTLLYTVLSVGLGIMMSIVISLVIDPLTRRVQTFYRSAFYLPGVMPGVVMAIVWAWMYNPNYGLLNTLFEVLGLPEVLWLANPKIALYSIILTVLISGQGSTIMIFLAALGNMPRELFEASEIDGASKLEEIFYIKLPLLKPTLLYTVVVNTIGSFQVFDRVYLLTKGGPDGSTTTLGLSIYFNGFERFNFGYASAQSIILFILIGLVALIQFKLLSSENDQ